MHRESRIIHVKEMTPSQQALLAHMELRSEERWCAGWLSDLHLELLGDAGYEWLVDRAGGWFIGHYPNEFVAGTLDELKEANSNAIR